ncbi:diacylglycerol/lipid kinase family protein [Candidatus Hydrogenedentota bacterium]
MHRRKDIVIITNPAAGKGRSAHKADLVAKSLREMDNEVEVVRTSGPGGAEHVAAGIDGGCDLVVAVGGDGTLHEVINNLASDIPVAPFPAGTANAVALGFGIPSDIEESAKIYDAFDIRRVDVGKIGESKFLLCISAGCDAEVVRRLAAARKGSIAVLSYLRPIIGAFKGYRFPEFSVKVDGETVSDRATLAVVGNMREYGMHMPVALNACITDGLLDICILESRSFLNHLRFYGHVLNGSHLNLRGVHYRTGRRIAIEPRDVPAPLQIDGEAAGHIPVDIEIVPEALSVCVGPDNRIDNPAMVRGEQSAI